MRATRAVRRATSTRLWFRWLGAAALALSLAAGGPPLFAQGTGGATQTSMISGQVVTRGSLGGVVVLPGATISATDEARGRVVHTTADDGGRFSLRVTHGTWTLRATVPGFQEAQQPVTVPPGWSNLEILLTPASLCETLQVFVTDLADQPVDARVKYNPNDYRFSGMKVSPRVSEFRTGPGGTGQMEVCAGVPPEKIEVLLQQALDEAAVRGLSDALSLVAEPDRQFPLPGSVEASAAGYLSGSAVLHLMDAGWTREAKAHIKLKPVEPAVATQIFNDGGIGIQVGVRGSQLDGLGPILITDNRTVSVGGQTVSQTSQTLTFDAFTGQFSVASEETAVGVGAHCNFAHGAAPGEARAAGAAARRPSPRSSRARAVTSLQAWVGRSDVELQYDKLDDASPGGRDTLWSGSGTLVRLGIAETLRLGRRGSLTLGYAYEQLLETPLTRSPQLSAGGGRLIRDEGRFERGTHEARALLGWRLGAVSPWAGVRWTDESVRLTGDAAAQLDSAQGLVEQTITFVNEFEAGGILADFGLDVRVPRTQLVLRAQAATDGSDLRFAVNAGYGWSFGR